MSNYRFKLGSVDAELITAASIAATETSITHHLGKIPTSVIVTPTTAVAVGKTSDSTSSVVKLTSASGTITADVLVMVASETH
jgi:hypothetical protein